MTCPWFRWAARLADGLRRPLLLVLALLALGWTSRDAAWGCDCHPGADMVVLAESDPPETCHGDCSCTMAVDECPAAAPVPWPAFPAAYGSRLRAPEGQAPGRVTYPPDPPPIAAH